MRWLLSLLLCFTQPVWADATANLITNTPGVSGTGVWIGIGGHSQLNGQHPTTLWGCCTSYSGSNPFLDTSSTNGNGQSGQIIWSYGQTAVQQIIAVNQALANAGAGVQVTGYNWSYELRNMNGISSQNGVDTLTATSRLWAPNYSGILLSETRTHNTRMDWTTFSSTVPAATAYDLANVGNLMIEFNSRDAGFWAGYYGPQIRNVQASLNYAAAPVDPCVANPTSSPTCPDYSNIQTSVNLVPDANHWTTNGAVINNTYAINSALALSGSQVRIHGFDYGYQYNLAEQYCSNKEWVMQNAYVCHGFSDPQVTVNFSVKDSNGNVIHSQPYTHSGTNTGDQLRSYQYRFDTSRDILSLGAIGFTGTTTENSTLFGMSSRAVYTNDSCVTDQLSSPTCPGYAAAYHDQQCSLNALHAVTCPGYAAAYFTQQCGISALYNAACPGYAAAYHDQQCSLSALHAVTCPGYQQAYFDQQCGLDSLYDNQCPGYQQAYFDQQCGLNALYDQACPGYQQAYFDQQCGLDSLYDQACPGYQQAYFDQQCNLSALYDQACPGYQQAYFDQQCGLDSLYDNQCPGYQQAYLTQQCGIDSLYSQQCPNYQSTLAACAANPLTQQTCPGYSTAVTVCAANSLSNSYCSGYSQALAACDSNPLSNTLCSGYAAANQACSSNSLLYTYCPNYTSTLSACSANPQSNTLCPTYSSTASSSTNNAANVTSVAVSTSEPTVTVKDDGKVDTAVAVVADPTVNSVLAKNSDTARVTETKTETPVTTTAQPTQATPAVSVQTQRAQQQEARKTEAAVQQVVTMVETRETQDADTTTNAKENSDSSEEKTSSADSKDKDSKSDKKSNSKAKQREAVKQAATEKARELANDMSRAATIEAQTASQAVVLGLMNYTPGFDSYSNAIVPDTNARAMARQYNRDNVDNRSVLRRLSGASERMHQEMVDQQYELRR